MECDLGMKMYFFKVAASRCSYWWSFATVFCERTAV